MPESKKTLKTSTFVRKRFIWISILMMLFACNQTTISSPTETVTPLLIETSTSSPTATLTPALPSTITPTIVINTYPQIDGQVSENEWKNQSFDYSLPHGVMHYINDDRYLYMLIDLIEDTGNDSPLDTEPWGDFFYITFDTETIAEIDANKDINYALYPGSFTLSLQYYLNQDEWTTLSTTQSKFAAGFGPSFNSSTPHRIWEFAFDLNEIHAQSDDTVYVGIRTYSQTPAFDNYLPDRFTQKFDNLIPLFLTN